MLENPRSVSFGSNKDVATVNMLNSQLDDSIMDDLQGGRLLDVSCVSNDLQSALTSSKKCSILSTFRSIPKLIVGEQYVNLLLQVVCMEDVITYDKKPKIRTVVGSDQKKRFFTLLPPMNMAPALIWKYFSLVTVDGEQKRKCLILEVYVILGERKSTNESKFVTPLLHVLMIQSDSAAYEKMWAMIRVKLPSFNPNSVSGDYELAAINAVLTAYSYNIIKFFGCAFHFRYSMDQQANKKRVSKIFKKPVPYVKKRLMFVLAYVRIDKVEEYAKVVAALITEPELLEYKKSFFKTWIGNSTFGKRPRYKHEWWNLFERIKNGNSDTNSYSESDNACLSKLMGVKKPGVWRFMLRLEAVYDHYEARYHEFLAPHVIRKKFTYEETMARVIKQTVDRFENLTAKEYLYAIVKATTTSGS